PAFYNKLVISVHSQSFTIITDTPFSIHCCQLHYLTLAIPSTLLIQSLYPLYFLLSIQVQHHLFLPSSSHKRLAHPSLRTLIAFQYK
ncbi:hypothetical protein BDR04DRAFT_1102551, partial [Suillus decipiens]